MAHIQALEPRLVLSATIGITATDASLTEPDGPGPATDTALFTLTRTDDASSGSDMLTVNYAFGGQASHGTDYSAKIDGMWLSQSGSIMFMPGETTKTVTLEANYDGALEGAESLTMLLSSGWNYGVQGTGLATATINEAAPPSVTVTAPTNTTQEPIWSSGDMPTPGVFRIARTGSPMSSLTVQFTLGVAASSSDYSLTAESGNSSLIMPASNSFGGTTPGQITIEMGHDYVDLEVRALFGPAIEGDESVVLTVIDNGNAAYDVGQDGASAEIMLTDCPPAQLTIANPGTLLEAQQFTLDVTSTAPVESWVVNWGDGQIETIDAYGATTVSRPHHYFDDNAEDQYIVTVTGYAGTVARGSATRTLTVGNAVPLVPESLAFAPSAVIVGQLVSLSPTLWIEDGVAMSADAVHYRIDWDDGSESTGTLDGAGFVSNGSHVYGTAGTRTVTLAVWDDDMDPADAVTANGTIVVAPAPVPPTVAVFASEDSISEWSPVDYAPESVTFQFVRTGDTTSSLTVAITLIGTATSGADYTGFDGVPIPTQIMFAEGESTTELTLVAVNDGTLEGTEQFTLALMAGEGYVVDAALSYHTVEIIDVNIPRIESITFSTTSGITVTWDVSGQQPSLDLLEGDTLTTTIQFAGGRRASGGTSVERPAGSGGGDRPGIAMLIDAPV